MKKYITPEIEALALSTVDVITGSVEKYAAEDIAAEYGINADDVQVLSETISQMANNTWSW